MSIPAQHPDWVVQHQPFVPLQPTPPLILEYYVIPPKSEVDFSVLPLSSETRAALFQKRNALRGDLWSSNPEHTIILTQDYLKLLPEDCGGLVLPWKHNMTNSSAELERLYLTFNMGYTHLYQARNCDRSTKAEGALLGAIKCFKYVAPFIERCRTRGKVMDAQILNELDALGKKMATFSWLLLAHIQIEERLKKQTPSYDLNVITSTCYHNLSQGWLDICSLETKQSLTNVKAPSLITLLTPSKEWSLEPYCKGIVIGCQAMAEYFACRCVLLNPQEGIGKFYPSQIESLGMYRGVILSRLDGYLKLISKHGHGVHAFLDKQVTEPSLKFLYNHLNHYNSLTSHDPIPAFELSLYQGMQRDLPVTSLNTIEPLTYPLVEVRIAPSIILEPKPEQSNLDSLLSRIKTTFSIGSQTGITPGIQNEIQELQLILNTDPNWKRLSIDLMDIIKYRQQNPQKIPLEFALHCKTIETTLLYLLESLPRMPKSLFDGIELTVKNEIVPFYESLNM